MAALLLTGCAANLYTLRESDLSPSAKVPGMKGFVQKENMCGPASLATLLIWAGEKTITPEIIAPLLYTPAREGTFLIDLKREIRQRGYLAATLDGELLDLLREVQGGTPVLVLENRGISLYPVYHYSVATGFDLDKGTITLLDGRESPYDSELNTFGNTWQRAGSIALMALPPGRLPLTTPKGVLLKALNDLEGMGHRKEARPGYRAFVVKFPDYWHGYFALGNALYAVGDKAGAEEALLLATKLDPTRPEPSNNLALLAHEEGRFEEAVTWAMRAREAAMIQGVDPTPYNDTLRDVSPPLPENFSRPSK